MMQDLSEPPRLSLRFADGDLERAYLTEALAKTLRFLQIACGLALAMSVLGFAAVMTGGLPAPAEGSGMATVLILVCLLAVYIVGATVPLFTMRPWMRHLVAVMCLSVGLLAAVALMVIPGHDVALFCMLWAIVHIFNVALFLPFGWQLVTAANVIDGTACTVAFVASGSSAGWESRPFIAAFWMGILFACVGARLVERSGRREFLARRKSDQLLLNVLPQPIAERLKSSDSTIADAFDACTVLFSDIVGFTVISQKMAPQALVDLLNNIFTRFDALADKHGVEKIKTIGDAYMVAAGLPHPRADHADALADMALDMRRAVGDVDTELGFDLSIRIGIHSGPAVAGVIGKRKFAYDLWGDTVNTASRMESHGLPGEIQVSAATKDLLASSYVLEERDTIEVKGKGPMKTWILRGRKDGR